MEEQTNLVCVFFCRCINLQGGIRIRGHISKPKESLGHERISTIVFFKLSKGLVLEQTREKEIQRFEVGLVGFPFCLVSALAVVGPHISLPIYIYKIYTPGMGPRKEYLGLAGDQNW
jgi:hypothetical protein